MPALPPQGDVESRAVLKVSIAARAAVAELKAAGQLIPSQGVLVNSILLLEAQASSESWTMNKIVAVRGLLGETTQRMRRDSGHIYSRALAEVVFVRPYCQIVHVVEAGLAKRQTARRSSWIRPFIDLLKRD